MEHRTLSSFVEQARSGAPVFVTDMRIALQRDASEDRARRVDALLVLPDGSSVRRFSIPVVDPEPLDEPHRSLLRDYIRAEIYNHLATLGGYSLTLAVPSGATAVRTVLEEVVTDFQIGRARGDRTGVARIVNVLDRMADALHPSLPAAERAFAISIADAAELPPGVENVRFRAEPTDALRRVTTGVENLVICGIDIGGTDIKAAVTRNGELLGMKEYDWNPGSYAEVEAIVDPIVVIARLLRARVSLEEHPDARGAAELRAEVTEALAHEASLTAMLAASERAESALGGRVRRFDAVGLCFPDVVVRNRIVGGEVPKAVAMRANPDRDFEEQFARLSRLNERLAELCDPDAPVVVTNDGPMAAFTAAVELAASPTPELVGAGVFAHSLGTDLGTGLTLADGTIPEIPLEAYNLILDLGSYPARSLPPRDLRSLANTNTGISGTPQKLASQAGAFRLANALLQSRPDLMERIEREGFVVAEDEGSVPMRVVPESPVDQRKAYLAHLFDLARSEPEAAELFRVIGEYLAVVYRETERILETGLHRRFLFGRFVKAAHVFRLLQEGATRREPELELVAADGGMAFTPLMRALDADPDYTVAQFGQSIGAIYFANLALVMRASR